MTLSRHPNLLPVFGSFVNGSKLFIVTPFLSGGSGLDIMKTAFQKGMEESIIATILKQVLQGLEYLHAHGLIHRDIKAGNLLVHNDGLVQLADFGVSSSLTDHGSRGTSRKTFVGTPCWMVLRYLNLGSRSNGPVRIRLQGRYLEFWNYGIGISQWSCPLCEVSSNESPHANPSESTTLLGQGQDV